MFKKKNGVYVLDDSKNDLVLLTDEELLKAIYPLTMEKFLKNNQNK